MITLLCQGHSDAEVIHIWYTECNLTAKLLSKQSYCFIRLICKKKTRLTFILSIVSADYICSWEVKTKTKEKEPCKHTVVWICASWRWYSIICQLQLTAKAKTMSSIISDIGHYPKSRTYMAILVTEYLHNTCTYTLFNLSEDQMTVVKNRSNFEFYRRCPNI